MNIDIIAGARPNFIKISPLIDAIKLIQEEGADIHYRLIHTGQHFDDKMSKIFFDQLNIPEPHINFKVNSGSQAELTAQIMIEYEKTLEKQSTDICLVVGDVTSTMACAIVAKKMNVKLAHVEAGIRSGDNSMPEEINRIVTDSLTDYFYTTSEFANKNLKKFGVEDDKIIFVGNTMVDTLLKNINNLIKPDFFDKLELNKKKYFLLTLHRPSNVDNEENLRLIINTIIENTNGYDIIFPVHPRTEKTLKKIDINAKNLHLLVPQPYLEFNYCIKHASCVITDSGGITEEATMMDTPCMSLRDNTERPETITLGTNELVGSDCSKISEYLKKIYSNSWKRGKIPPLWDGNSAKRIISHLIQKAN